MKKESITALALVLALLLGGCGLFEAPAGQTEQDRDTRPGAGMAEDTEKRPESKRDAIPFEDGQLYAAAYLGYQETGDLDYYADLYLDSAELPTYTVSDGDYYLIIPRYAGMSMTLSVIDIETSRPKVLLREPDCGPFVLQCNISDVLEDALIWLEYEGDSVEFSPYISLENGAPQMGERGLDLTKPESADD